MTVTHLNVIPISSPPQHSSMAGLRAQLEYERARADAAEAGLAALAAASGGHDGTAMTAEWATAVLTPDGRRRPQAVPLPGGAVGVLRRGRPAVTDLAAEWRIVMAVLAKGRQAR